MSSGPAGEEDPQRLTCEWLLADYFEINGGCPSVVRFDLAAMGPVPRLTVHHRGPDPDGSLLKVITPGWSMILPSLKSLVETDEPLEFRLSARATADGRHRSLHRRLPAASLPSAPTALQVLSGLACAGGRGASGGA